MKHDHKAENNEKTGMMHANINWHDFLPYINEFPAEVVYEIKSENILPSPDLDNASVGIKGNNRAPAITGALLFYIGGCGSEWLGVSGMII